ncbi:unnamed protein product [Triticum turgidum subsp. durum]|uniref:galactinol--sucrose galactosyltransferase n=1 Tax=Triticum turgidum subsp. durum TaxID=4567 RepID=A0A9R0VGV5_TRITD|nr:unnamed protein product [Triticum turgidum subsp. durum]
MTVTPQITVSDGRLEVRGRTVLSGVPDNITAAHAAGAGLVDGAFVGATAGEAKSHHVFTFGTHVPVPVQAVVDDAADGHLRPRRPAGDPIHPHRGPCRRRQRRRRQRAGVPGDAAAAGGAVPHGAPGQRPRPAPYLHREAGDKAVQTEQGMNSLYIHAGTNPFDTITQAVRPLRSTCRHSTTGRRKRLPSFVDWFGWCTWDAFYTDVTADGVKQGLRSLAEGGVPPRFLIIDDGWQQIGSENKEDPGVAVQEGAQFASRLTGIKENTKFQSEHDQDDTPGLKRLVEETKKGHGVKSVYVWHAMAGYWGGVKPSAAGMEHYESALAYPVQSPGVTGNQPDIVMDSLSVLGLGLVHPRKVYNFYDELHAYLAACGVDGVKVDVQNIVETLGAGHGGRVALTRAYHRALEASVARNFPDNGCISCMCHNTDMLYSAKQTAVVRASDDFYPRDPASHTVHISSVAYNTLFLGEFMQPDWDMLPGGGVPRRGEGHRRLPDLCQRQAGEPQLRPPQEAGSPRRLRAPRAAPRQAHNMNKCAGVVGVFNCQGAGWCRIVKKTRIHDEAPGTLTGSVRAEDVEGIAQAAGTDDCTGDAVVYAYRAGELVRLPRGATLPVTLKRLEYELFHVCPIRTVAPDVSFAPIGLLHMFNAGGAVEECTVRPDEDDKAVVSLRVRGCGLFGAYCSRRPVKCSLDSGDVGFGYDADTGLVTVDVPVPEKEMYRWALEIRV